MATFVNAANSTEKWSAESPFMDRELEQVGHSQGSSGERLSTFLMESPFLSETEMGLSGEAPDGNAEALTELFAELHDQEFDIAVQDLMGEASTLTATEFESESVESRSLEARLERRLDDYFYPLLRRSEEMLEGMAESLAPADPFSMSEAELNEALERGSAGPSMQSPAFEMFLKRLKKKVMGVVKKGVSLAKKGIGAVAKMGVGPVLKKLKALIKPLLKKVAQMAMNKLPASYRPLVQSVAQHFGWMKKIKAKKSKKAEDADADASASTQASAASTEDSAAEGQSASAALSSEDSAGQSTDSGVSEDAVSGKDACSTCDCSAAATAVTEPSGASVEDVQEGLDAQMGEVLMARDEAEAEVATAAYLVQTSAPAADPLGELDRARNRFVSQLAELEQNADPTPLVERFVPAILGAVKLGVKLIGRPRVVAFLGQMIGRLITPIVGKEVAPKLGKAIADLGLKVISVNELPARTVNEAGLRAVSSTVEETVRRVAALPADVLNSETLLEGYALEAFEAASAANFPPAFLKPQLHEALGLDGMWVPVPPQGRAYYKKYSKVLDINLRPQVTDKVHIYGGGALRSFLRDTLRLPADQPLRAKIHLFELLPGGRLYHIAARDQARGLGKYEAWKLLHPLTVEAATALLGQPGLGRTAPSANALDTFVGQRVYYLDIDAAPSSPLGRMSGMSASVNFPGDEISVKVYLSEVLAQETAQMLRKKAAPGVVLAHLRAAFAQDSAALAAGGNPQSLKLSIAPPTEKGKGRATLASSLDRDIRHALRAKLGRQIVEWTWKKIADQLSQNTEAFWKATSAPSDGVTVTMLFRNPPGLAAIRKVFRGGNAGRLDAWPPPGIPESSIRIEAGA